MPIMTELIVSVVGGVLTAAILATFSRPGRAGRQANAPAAPPPRRRGRSFTGDLLRVIVAVAGGIAIAVVGGRLLIQAGILPQGLPTRLALLVGGTVICWIIIASGRR
jgi:hypothetical protein